MSAIPLEKKISRYKKDELFGEWKYLGDFEIRKIDKGRALYLKLQCSCGYVGFRNHVLVQKLTHCRECQKTKRNFIASRETHGMSKTRVYKIWEGIKSRCYCKRDSSYMRYGGKGIKVCERWLGSFESFYEDMGDPPSDSHSIDRIDFYGNYDPSNCRWATILEQSYNRRSSWLVDMGDEVDFLAKVCLQNGITSDVALQRIKRGWSVYQSIKTPKGGIKCQEYQKPWKVLKNTEQKPKNQKNA